MNNINIEDLKSLLSMIGLFKEIDNEYEYEYLRHEFRVKLRKYGNS
jgi:hypothetical protein